MQITVQIKLLPTKEQAILINDTLGEYINTVNNVVSEYVSADKDLKYSSKNVVAGLPSALKAQVTQDAKSIFKKYTKNLKVNAKKEPAKQKEIKVPILKKPVAIWNNQNYSIKFGHISFPVWLNDKSTRIVVKAIITEYQENQFYEQPVKVRIEKKTKNITIEVINYIDDELIVGKYIIPTKEFSTRHWKSEKRISRIIENQFRFHVDTENIRRCPNVISPDSLISITYKVHWTSAIYANVLTIRQLTWLEKLAKRFWVNVKEEEYNLLYSSRKVVKNEYETKDKNGFYDTDIWWDVKKEIEPLIPAGYTIYGEIIWYTSSGKNIQAEYDYGCAHWSHKFMVYRITFTNPHWIVFELNTTEIRNFCERAWLVPVHLLYYWQAKDLYPEINLDEEWNVNFIKQLEKDFTGKNCFMCGNSVPEEWIVIRVEKNHYNFEAYKLKSFEFMEYESKNIDKNWDNMEG